MSVLSTVALLVTAIATRVTNASKTDPRDAEIIGLKIDIADLQRQRDELMILVSELNAPSRLYSTQAQYHQAQMQQIMAQAQNFPGAQQIGMGGLANVGPDVFNESFNEFCNCVPARHDVLMRQSSAY
jgi:hypothetical protein